MKRQVLDFSLSLSLSLGILGIGFYIIQPFITTLFMVNFLLFIISIILYFLLEGESFVRRILKIFSISGAVSSTFIAIAFYIMFFHM